MDAVRPSFRRCLTVLSGLLAALALFGAARGGFAQAQDIQLPDIGDPSRAVFSTLAEQQVGQAFMREIRSQVDVVNDPFIDQYIQSLGQKLVAHSAGDNRHFTFFVVNDPTINAFAGPGGFIGVNTGLITTTETESELAAVLAHEIAHVTQGHIARDIAHNKKMSIPAIAGLAAAILVGINNPQMGQAAAAALAGVQAQSQINFTRGEEEEADRIGMQDLYASGFNPRAMPAFFERMQREMRYYQQPPAFLLDHPVTTQRIADSLNRADAYPYKQYPTSLTYFLVRARVKVLEARDPQDAVQEFSQALKTGQYRDEEAARYGLVVALMAAGDNHRARQALAPLLKKDPERIPFLDALARIELAENHVEKAVKVYADAREIYPDDAIIVRGYSNALLQAGRPRKVIKLLNDYSQDGPLDARMYRDLAQAYQARGDTVEAEAALAEHYYRNGRLDAAIHQLKLAMKEPKMSFYQSSRIQARLQQFEAEKKARTSQQ